MGRKGEVRWGVAGSAVAFGLAMVECLRFSLGIGVGGGVAIQMFIF